MSYAMNMFCPISTEFSVIIGNFIYEIQMVNHHGWVGKDKYSIDRLEITKFLYCNGEKFDFSSDQHFYFLDDIESGRYDDLKHPENPDQYYKYNTWQHEIINNLATYKEVIKKFREASKLKDTVG